MREVTDVKMRLSVTLRRAGWLAGCLVSTASVMAVEALQNVEAAAYAAIVENEAGFTFQPASNIVVTSLGYTFGNSVDGSYVVQMVGPGGAVLASALVSASGAPGNQFIYAVIPPLQLSAGSTTYVTGYDAERFATNGTKFWSGNAIDESQPNGGSFGVAPELVYLGATDGTNLIAGPEFLLVGPGFEFTPIPAVVPSELSIIRTLSNTVVVSWPVTDPSGQLQTAPDLATAMTDVTATPVIVGGSKTVELPILDAQAYFRLRYP